MAKEWDVIGAAYAADDWNPAAFFQPEETVPNGVESVPTAIGFSSGGATEFGGSFSGFLPAESVSATKDASPNPASLGGTSYGLTPTSVPGMVPGPINASLTGVGIIDGGRGGVFADPRQFAASGLNHEMGGAGDSVPAYGGNMTSFGPLTLQQGATANPLAAGSPNDTPNVTSRPGGETNGTLGDVSGQTGYELAYAESSNLLYPSRAVDPSSSAAAAGNTVFTVTTPGSGLVFNNTITGSYSGNTLTEFENDIVSAETNLETQATNSFTINVELEAENQGANGDGANNDSLVYGTYSYSQLITALKAKEAGNPIGQIAMQHLPATDPSGGVGFYLPTAYARFLGLSNASGGVEIVNGQYESSTSYPFDSGVILNTNYVSDFGQDAIDALTHELSETEMGRVGGLGSDTIGATPDWTTMDLFRYNAAGQYDTADGKDGDAAYFSYNGGQTTSGSASLAFFNNYNTQGVFTGGDNDDFTYPTGGNSINPNSAPDIFGPVSTVPGLSQTDDEILEALGWDPMAPPAPSGLALPAVSNGGRIVPTSTPTITGFGQAGDTVRLDDGSIAVGNATVAANGSWSIVTSPLALGLHSLTAIETDANGNVSTPSSPLLLGVSNGLSGLPLADTAATSDFFGVGVSDVLFQNISGQVGIWQVDDNTILTSGNPQNPGSSWQAVGTGSFFGNGMSDILFQNTDGQVGIWEMNGLNIVATGNPQNPGTNWHMVGTGDFFGNGISDILFQNTNGDVGIWEMNGSNIVAEGNPQNPGPSWHVIGTGDFFGNGMSDILFQNTDGQVGIWEMNGFNIVASGNPQNPGPSWHVIGTGDFYGNGISDILFQNTDGQVGIWEMNGFNIVASGNPQNPGSSWHVIGAGDYNGDGKSDILFQNTSGQVGIWEMSGASIISSGNPQNPGTSWHLIPA